MVDSPSRGGDAVPPLISPSSRPPGPDAPALPRWRLLLFLYDYALSVHRAPGFRTAPYWTHMVASLADPALPLRTLPWTRQPAAVPQHR